MRTRATLALAVALLAPIAPAADHPTPTVTFATDWDSAVAEAKLLGVPIVVHSHGFY